MLDHLSTFTCAFTIFYHNPSAHEVLYSSLSAKLLTQQSVRIKYVRTCTWVVPKSSTGALCLKSFNGLTASFVDMWCLDPINKGLQPESWGAAVSATSMIFMYSICSLHNDMLSEWRNLPQPPSFRTTGMYSECGMDTSQFHCLLLYYAHFCEYGYVMLLQYNVTIQIHHVYIYI